MPTSSSHNYGHLALTNTWDAIQTYNAVAEANGGIKFPGVDIGSTNVNTLDDYEEGTYTLTDASGAGLVFSYAAGEYIKIGRAVFVNFQVLYPATASAAPAKIQGLPFLCSSITNSGLAFGFLVSTRPLVAQVINNSDTVEWGDFPSTVTILNSHLTNGNLLVAGWYPIT